MFGRLDKPAVYRHNKLFTGKKRESQADILQQAKLIFLIGSFQNHLLFICGQRRAQLKT
jgi:hypothetical protein